MKKIKSKKTAGWFGRSEEAVQTQDQQFRQNAINNAVTALRQVQDEDLQAIMQQLLQLQQGM